MKQLLLIGAGGHCKSCIDVIEQIGEWQFAGFTKENIVVEYSVLEIFKPLCWKSNCKVVL